MTMETYNFLRQRHIKRLKRQAAVKEFYKKRHKVVFIMGATGTGKSKLSIDLATHFPSEIINSNKLQFYFGLDIVTNKVTEEESRGVPLHMIGFLEHHEDLTPHTLCEFLMCSIEGTLESGHIPLIVGPGTDSIVEYLVENPKMDLKKKFDCCFFLMNVSPPVLYNFVIERVDKMVDAGLIDEVREIWSVPEEERPIPEPLSLENYKGDWGVRAAVGVIELKPYFQKETDQLDDENKRKLLGSCIKKIKENACMLADRQMNEIKRLISKHGWEVHQIDATAAFERSGQNDAELAWEVSVLNPAMKIMGEFLKKDDQKNLKIDDQSDLKNLKIDDQSDLKNLKIDVQNDLKNLKIDDQNDLKEDK